MTDMRWRITIKAVSLLYVHISLSMSLIFYFLYSKINQRMIIFSMRKLNFPLNELHKGQELLYLFSSSCKALIKTPWATSAST